MPMNKGYSKSGSKKKDKKKRPSLGKGMAESAAKQIERNKKRKQSDLDRIMKEIKGGR